MSRLVALDTETTGLDPATEDVFEIAVVNLDHGACEFEYRIRPRSAVVERMHPKAAEVNRYHERTADPEWTWQPPEDTLTLLAQVLDGAHIVGAVPDFDTRHLTSLYRRFGMEPPRWHYHLIDVETLAVGWLYGKAYGHTRATEGESVQFVPGVVEQLPWRSDDLARACGVEPPSDDERHTAIGDARWVARWYHALTAQVSS